MLDYTERHYYSFSEYLKKKYPRRTYRVSVDAGFSCPNREDRESSGCLFCGEEGSRAPYLGSIDDIAEQIRRSVVFLKSRYRAENFLLYFQAFSNTHAPVEELKRIYDFALEQQKFEQLIISTRPDCLDPEKVKLIASYQKQGLEVWVELGLQSSHNETLDLVNRGHSYEDFLQAYEWLEIAGINRTVHLIFGLPHESRQHMMTTVQRVSQLKPQGVKIHNLHIVKGTPLYEMFKTGEFQAFSYEEHLDAVIAALEILPPETVIMRLVCDTMAGKLAAPLDFPPKAKFLQLLDAEMEKRGSWQGRLYQGL